MAEGVYMTTKEINRAEVFLKVKNGQLKQTQAANELCLSDRHTQRLYKAFIKHGVKALASKKRGTISNNQLQSLIKSRVKELITLPIYAGFGPTFMCETLKKRHQIDISKETTRKLRIEQGAWVAKNKKSPVIHH